MTSQTDSATIAEITRLETERCRAISEQDYDALEALLTEGNSHVHRDGLTQNKADYIQRCRSQGGPMHMRREDLQFQVLGDTVVVTGRMIQTYHPPKPGVPDTYSAVTQTWVKQDGAWKEASFHACLINPGFSQSTSG